MIPIPINIILFTIVSYAIGCFSAARLVALHFKQLNIYKVGSGHPDTENIYQNVSKPLGVLAGIIDMAKMYFFLLIVSYLFRRFGLVGNGHAVWLQIFGFAMIVGHCLPATNRFKGGRGLFTFIGFASFFVFWPMVIVVTLALIVIFAFKQIRFAQYMIVLLPPFVSYFFPCYKGFFPNMLVLSILMGIMNYIVSKRLGEI
jgi:acyl phosphate:glycerol-3-phosphate acyltransferase